MYPSTSISSPRCLRSFVFTTSFASFASLVLIALFLTATLPLSAQRQTEKLGRGVVALRSSTTQVYVGWRLLGNDPDDIAFNLYRSANGAAAVKLNATPLSATTDYVDTPADLATTAYAYSVRPVIDGAEVPDTWAHYLSAAFTLPLNAPVRQYLRIPLQATPDGALDVKFCWVGDLDGDGEYDFVVDRQPAGETRQFLEAYKRDGTFLWRMNLGPNSTYHYNIEPGSSTVSIGHGDNVTVYDMDGDGRAEVVIRTANGVIFGDGTTLTAADNNAQFLSIVDGQTGSERARAPIPAPWLSDGPMNGHMGILFADGLRPTVLWASKNRRADNGFNGIVTMWNFRNGQLTQRSSWTDTGVHSPEGHQIRIGDVDNDGKDEFLDIGYALDDSGTQQVFNLPEVVHGDRFHTTDIDPDRPGLETFIIQQNNGSGLATAYFDAGTGKIIKKWYAGGVVDVGRGVIADIDASARGYEMFSTQPGIFDAKGNQLYSARPFPPETIWWNADLSREFVGVPGSSGESPVIDAFNPANPGTLSRLYTIYNEGVHQAYGGRPAFWGDILGDWREELVLVANDNSELRIYTTKLPAGNRLYTLMHNPQYRMQTTTKGYVQSSYVDYFLGNGMTPPPPPPMVDAKLVWRGGPAKTTWDADTSVSWIGQSFEPRTFATGDTVRFDLSGDNSTTVALNGQLTPGAVTVYSPTHYTFDGTAGSLSGATKLTKAGAGTLTISGNHSFSGRTTVWDGALVVNGDFQQSPVTVWGGTWGGALANGITGGRIAGTGRFSQPVSLKYRGAIAPGTGMGNAGTLTLAGGLTADDGSVLALDLSDDPSGATRASDRIAVTGNVTLTGKVAVVIKALNGQLVPGTYTLLTYTGTLTGGTANLAVAVPAGTPHTIAAAYGAITLTVPVTRPSAPVVWRGSDSTWDLAASQNWLRDGAPDVFVSGDTVTFDTTGAASSFVNLSTTLPVTGVAVNGTSNYSFSGTGSISGPAAFTKSGPGTLTVNTTNDYTGPTVISGGVLAVDNLNDGGKPSSLGAASTDAANLILDGGTLRLTGAQTNTNRSLTLGAAGGTLDIASTGSSLQISGSILGAGKLTKNGSGTLILANANTYAGGTLINIGTIYLAGAIANASALGTGAVTLNNGTLTMADVQASETAAWNLIVPASSTGRLDADGRCSLTGTLTGGGTFWFFTPYVRTDLKGNWSAFTGRINVVSDSDGGDFRIANSFGFGIAALDLGDQVYAYYNNAMSGDLTLDIGALFGASTASLRGGPTAGRTLTWRIGRINAITTYAGTIANSTGITAITKTGPSTLILAGASTYTGPTTIESGRLTITGSLTGSAITVLPGAELAGSGKIAGNIAISGTHRPALAAAIVEGTLSYASGSRLAAQLNANSASTGTLTSLTTGNLTIATGSSLDVTLNGAGSTVDFSDAFWGAARQFTILSPTARTGTFALGTVSPDSKGVTADSRGHFSVRHDGANVVLDWSPRVAGAAREVGSNIVHLNGNVYDQSLLTGTFASFTADPGQIHRISFVDLTNDIVQVEFSGAGTVTITLLNPTGPATPVNYVQPTVQYMKGHASITVADTDETTNLSIFSVGRATAVNQSLFRDNVAYDGFADIKAIFILSTAKKFGGLRTANANYFDNSLFAGLDANSVAFSGPIFIGDISAFDTATPELKFGSATDVRITGGDLQQPNNRAIQVDGIAPLQFTAGSNSHGVPQPAQPNRARFEKNGVDVTTQLVP